MTFLIIIVVIIIIYYYSPDLILRRFPEYRELKNAVNDLDSQYFLTKKALAECTNINTSSKESLNMHSKRLAECSANLASYIKRFQLASNGNKSCLLMLNKANAKLKAANELLVKNFEYNDKELVNLLNALRDNLSIIVDKKITLANNFYSGKVLGDILNRISDDLELTTRQFGMCKHYNKEKSRLGIAKALNMTLGLVNTNDSLVSLVSSSSGIYYVVNNNSKYYNLVLNIENIISHVLADKLCRDDGLVDAPALKELAHSIQKHLQDSSHLLKHSQGIFDVAAAGLMSIIPGFIKQEIV